MLRHYARTCLNFGESRQARYWIQISTNSGRWSLCRCHSS